MDRWLFVVRLEAGLSSEVFLEMRDPRENSPGHGGTSIVRPPCSFSSSSTGVLSSGKLEALVCRDREGL